MKPSSPRGGSILAKCRNWFKSAAECKEYLPVLYVPPTLANILREGMGLTANWSRSLRHITLCMATFFPSCVACTSRASPISSCVSLLEPAS